MKMGCTQVELARAVGVSQPAVAAVLGRSRNRPGTRVSAATRRKILAAARRLNYRPHRPAQMLRGVRSGTIGVIADVEGIQVSVERSYFTSAAIYGQGYDLMANYIMWSRGGLKRAVEAMLDARVEGVLLNNVNHFERASSDLRPLRDANIPVVSLSGDRLPSIPIVQSDFRQGMFDLTRHLLSLGYRRLTLVSSLRDEEDRSTWGLRERLEGFRAAAADAGLTGDEAQVLWQPMSRGLNNGYEAGRAAMERLLNAGKLPQAVLCTNDDYAIGAIGKCLEAGLSVPRDLAVTGFDNTSAGRYQFPPLTTVAQPTQDLARTAVEWLFKLIRGQKVEPDDQVVKLPCEVIVRRSCGAAAQSTSRHLSTSSRSPGE